MNEKLADDAIYRSGMITPLVEGLSFRTTSAAETLGQRRINELRQRERKSRRSEKNKKSKGGTRFEIIITDAELTHKMRLQLTIGVFCEKLSKSTEKPNFNEDSINSSINDLEKSTAFRNLDDATYRDWRGDAREGAAP
uniref:Uncharacterized protein n=1 Tax=Romanomermis culicivorax TaxID=13658 RepID=A0A915JHQ1_ROMCU